MQRPRPRISPIAILFGLLCAISLLGLAGCVVAPAPGYYGGGAAYYSAPVVYGGYGYGYGWHGRERHWR